jgi:hypothetical protein
MMKELQSCGNVISRALPFPPSQRTLLPLPYCWMFAILPAEFEVASIPVDVVFSECALLLFSLPDWPSRLFASGTQFCSAGCPVAETKLESGCFALFLYLRALSKSQIFMC